MLKKLITAVLLVLFVFAGCSQKDSLTESISITEDSSVISEKSEEPSLVKPETKPAAEILNDLANQEFSIKEDKISDNDCETIIAFGEAFVNLFTGAVAEQEPVSFKNYISNENLLKFANKMLELTQKRDLNGGFGVSFGLKNKFREAEFRKLDENLFYIYLPFEFEGSGQACKLLVCVENKKLKIADFYFGAKGGIDTIATGHGAVRKLDNPHLWDNQEWVDDVFEKLENYESERDS